LRDGIRAGFDGGFEAGGESAEPLGPDGRQQVLLALEVDVGSGRAAARLARDRAHRRRRIALSFEDPQRRVTELRTSGFDFVGGEGAARHEVL